MGVRNAEHLKIIVYISAPQDAAKVNATFQQCVRNAVHLKIVVELGAIKVATSANATFASSVANAMHLQIRRNTYKKRWCKGQRHLCKVCAQSTASQKVVQLGALQIAVLAHATCAMGVRNLLHLNFG